MDINFEAVLDRADIQQIRSFLLTGEGSGKVSADTYKNRLDGPRRKVIHEIEKKFPDMNENEPINAFFYDAVGAYEAVFMELGLQAGMKLAAQIMGDKSKTE